MPFVVPITVVPEKHLIVTGSSPAPILAAIDGKATTMGTDPTVGELTTAIGPSIYTMLRTGNGVCSKLPVAGSAAAKLLGPEKLAAPTALALAVMDDTHGEIIARYADAATARADEPRRSTLLTKAQSLLYRQPYTELLGPVTISASGSDLRYRFTALPKPIRLSQLIKTRDEPWAWC